MLLFDVIITKAKWYWGTDNASSPKVIFISHNNPFIIIYNHNSVNGRPIQIVYQHY